MGSRPFFVGVDPMANAVRGETAIEIHGVGRVVLCVTLASMGCLEDHFEVANLDEAMAIIGKEPSSHNLATLLHALTLGQPREYSVDEIRRWPIAPASIGEAMRALTAANASMGNVSEKPAENRAARRATGKAR